MVDHDVCFPFGLSGCIETNTLFKRGVSQEGAFHKSAFHQASSILQHLHTNTIQPLQHAPYCTLLLRDLLWGLLAGAGVPPPPSTSTAASSAPNMSASVHASACSATCSTALFSPAAAFSASAAFALATPAAAAGPAAVRRLFLAGGATQAAPWKGHGQGQQKCDYTAVCLGCTSVMP